MNPGHEVILWTVRISVAFYAAALWILCRPGGLPEASTDRYRAIFRWCWGLSWFWCVIHVIAAFHFQHRWSFSAGLKHTAEMTDRVVGVHWDGGMYINFVFLTAWAFDAFQIATGRRSTSQLMQWAAAFMMFNATVVFGPPWWWIPVILLIGALAVRRIGAASRRKNDNDSVSLPVN